MGAGTRFAPTRRMLPLLGPRSRLLALGAAALLAACSGVGAEDGQGEDQVDSALAGAAAEGTIVQTKANLRMRRTPTSADPSNIISVLPKGSDVRIRTATPTGGFYFIAIVDPELARRVRRETGWVYGAYLTGAKTDPDAPTSSPLPLPLNTVPGTPPTPAPTPPTPQRAELKVKFTPASCHVLDDDRGNPMFPTLDDYLNTSGYQNEVVVGIDSNEYPYGTLVRFSEIDARPAFAKMGHGVVFKVVKTSASAPGPTTTVTLCAALPAALPAAGSELTLKVIPPGF